MSCWFTCRHTSLLLCPYRLQKFKINIANTIISQDNSSLRSMNTAELLDLFRLSAGTSTTSGANQTTDSSSTVSNRDPLS